MKWIESFRMALKSIGTNKGRASLTMLGIIIGVSAVIIMVSLVQGSTRRVTDQLESFGTNTINVTILGRGSNRSIRIDEMLEFAEDNSDKIEAVVPFITSSVTVKFGTNNVSTTLQGTNETYKTAKNTDVQQGRFFNALDIERRQKVAMIGTYISQELFGDMSPLGKEIKINGEVFQVIGLLENKSSSSQGSDDDRVIMPYTTAQRLIRNTKVNMYFIQAKTSKTVDYAMTAVENFLFSVFQNTDSYQIMNQAQLLKQFSSITGTLTVMLGGIAGISLLVGGIGIMNIMLVSVTERIKEIGIRKAIGAKRSNILQQFLIEAIVVSSMGGIIGILFGFLVTSVISQVAQIPATPSVSIVMISFSFSALVGIFFGWYPANKASKLNPIQALRAE